MKIVSGRRWLFAAGLTVSLIMAGETVALAASSSSTPATWVHVPGAMVRAECVHALPKGAYVTTSTGDVMVSGVVQEHHEPCAEPFVPSHEVSSASNSTPDAPNSTGGGWVEDWRSASSVPFSYIYSRWVVPANPPAVALKTFPKGAGVAFWNGAETTGCYANPLSNCAIIQSVLTFGSDWGGFEWATNTPWSFGSDTSWAITSWYGDTSGNYWYTPPQPVSTGNTISGSQSIIATGNGWIEWLVQTSSSNGSWTDGWVSFPSNLQWTNAFPIVLESYYHTNCNQFPVGWEWGSDMYLWTGYPNQNTVAPPLFPEQPINEPVSGLYCGWAQTYSSAAQAVGIYAN